MITDKYKIIDHSNFDFGLSLGISMERQKEITEIMDEMQGGNKRMAYSSSVILFLEQNLDNKEEFLWAWTNFIYWTSSQNRMLSPEEEAIYRRAQNIDDLNQNNIQNESSN